MDSPLAPVGKNSTAGNLLPWANLLGFVAVIIFNAISATGLISDLDIAQVSSLYQTLITPAGWAFSIWGLIYFSVAVFVIWQCIPNIRDDRLVFDKIGWWFFTSCVFNVAWILAFVQATPVGWIWFSTVLLFAIFGSLLTIILRVSAWTRVFDVAQPIANDYFEGTSGQVPSRFLLGVSYFAVDWTFSIYCGWTTVASILNVALSLQGSGVDGSPRQDVWAIVILCIAASIFLAMVLKKRNWAYGFVFTWASAAIASEAKSTGCMTVVDGPGVYNDPAGCLRVERAASVLSAVLAAVSALVMVSYFYRSCSSNPSQTHN